MKGRWLRLRTKRDKKLFRVLVFLLRFVALSAPLHLAIWLGLDLSSLQRLVTDESAAAVRMTGVDVSVDGFAISAGPMSFIISPDCTAWKSMLAYAALVLAVQRAGWRKRAWGLAMGLPVIYAANIARIGSIIWIGVSYGNDAVQLFHLWTWRVGMIALIFLLWAAWMRTCRKG